MTIEKKADKKQVSQAQQEATVPAPRDDSSDMVTRGRPLVGAKCIAGHLDVCINTLMRYIYQEALPATQIGGVWMSDTSLIDRWLISRIESDTEARGTVDDSKSGRARW